MLLIVLAAAFGATGAGGPLSDTEATTPDGVLRLSYLDRGQCSSQTA